MPKEMKGQGLGSRTGNGNQFQGTDSTKSGGAEKGGPGESHAKRNQPKDSVIPKQKSSRD